MDDLVILALNQRSQLDVELDFLVRVSLHAQRSAAGLFDDMRNQILAGRVGEVIPNQRVALNIDLRRQLAVLVGGDEEVDMRRTVAMASEPVQQLLGRALRRATASDRPEAKVLR